MHRNFFSILFLAFFFAGCTVTPTQAPQSQIDKLSTLIYSLDTHVPNKESFYLSRDIFQKANSLTKEFDLTSPPLWHNFLVNIGLRKKGLCFDWSDALYLYLNKKNYPHYTFHLVGANIGEYFSEHNALAIVPKGMNIQEGILIDPWRDSGKVYFSKVKDDKAYRWTHRKDRGCQ